LNIPFTETDIIPFPRSILCSQTRREYIWDQTFGEAKDRVGLMNTSKDKWEF